MKRTNLLTTLLASLLVPLTTCAIDATFRFSGTSLDPNFTSTTDIGFSATVSAGALHFQKAAGLGPGSGYANVSSAFQLTGDFTVSVTATRGVGVPSTGLAVDGVGFSQDIYFVGPTEIYAAEAGSNSGSIGVSAATLTFRIVRIGTTISSSYDAGSGFQTVFSRSRAGMDRPVTIRLFLGQERPTTALATSTFDDLTFQSAGTINYVEPPPLGSVAIFPAIEITWTSETGRQYQVQRTDSLATPHWTDLGSPIQGTGEPISAFDATRSRQQRFYRVQTLP